jgi:uncharacterized Zn finger protein
LAQWSGQFSGNTHATRVQEAEAVLRHAVAALKSATADEERTKKANAVQQLAKRLLQARVRLLKARLASEPPPAAGLASLRQRLEVTQASGVAAILAEFGVMSGVQSE